MVFLTSPNNPDGGLTSTEDVEAILKLPVLVVSSRGSRSHVVLVSSQASFQGSGMCCLTAMSYQAFDLEHTCMHNAMEGRTTNADSHSYNADSRSHNADSRLAVCVEAQSIAIMDSGSLCKGMNSA